MKFLGFILVVAGIMCFLYAKVISVHDNTAQAMGSVALKILARIAAPILIILGIACYFAV